MVDTTVRRRGPRGDVDIRELILDTAERMFGDSSIGSVSLRAIAREAGVANRSVMYHFPAKRDLIAAVAFRRSGRITPAIAANLAALVDAPAEVGVRDVVEALLMPHVTLLQTEPVHGLSWLKVMTQLAFDDDPIWREALDGDPGLPDLFVAAAGRAIPGLHTRKVQQRAALAMYSMIAVLAGADLAAYRRPLGPDGLDPEWVEQVVEFACGGLRGSADS
ncbi:TetR/AcrR family transcriptional regulator [Mycobacterium sp. ZZG]